MLRLSSSTASGSGPSKASQSTQYYSATKSTRTYRLESTLKIVPSYKNCVRICFGGLGVACWPLVPNFAGSNPAEAVGFLGRKNPQHAFLRRGSKAVGPMS